MAENSSVCRVAGVSGANALHVVDKAHVQHAVGFVQDQHLQPRQVDAAALDMVDQPARRGDQEVDATLQRAILDRIRGAAVEAHDSHAQRLPITHRLFSHLLRELARGRQDQHARYARHPMLGYRRVGLCGDTVQRGQHECRCLAGAGLRTADDIASFQQRRDGLGLDGRRFVVAASGECLQDLRREVKFFKTHVRIQSRTK